MNAAVLWVCLALPTESYAFEEPVRPPRPVQAMAHRGLWRIAPENSASAIKACADHLVEWAEVDLRLTRDRRHVLIHNAHLDGTTDGHGFVRDFTVEELQKQDAGSPFARRFAGEKLLTLPEALALAKGRVNLYLDCKEVDPERLVKEIRDAGMERGVVVYAGGALLNAIDRAVGTGSRIPLMSKWRPKSETTEFLRTVKNLTAVEIDGDQVTPEVVRTAKGLGLKVQAKALGDDWDKPEPWGRLVDAGIDWIQTDWPVEFHAFLVNREKLPRPFRISCHRGASRQAPENTLGAIEAAVALGADFVELDVRTTRDGKYVLMHDGTLNRTTNGRGPVSQADFDEVRKLDAGGWFGGLYRGAQVPTLDEGLAALKGRAEFYCDAKDIPPEALAEALRRHGMVERTVVYGGVDFLKKLKAVDPAIKRMPALRRMEDIDALARDLKPHAFDVAWGILSRELVDRCHALGVKVFSDALGLHETVDDYRKAAEMGVDLIQTDFPDRTLRAIELMRGGERRRSGRPPGKLAQTRGRPGRIRRRSSSRSRP